MKVIKKIFVVLGCALAFVLQMYIMIDVVHGIVFYVKNDMGPLFAQTGMEKELELEYVGEQQIDLDGDTTFAEDIGYYQDLSESWQILSGYDYRWQNSYMDFQNRDIFVDVELFWGSYIISYGRKIEMAVYDPSIYHSSVFSKEKWDSPSFENEGYCVYFDYDDSQYYEGTVFIYKCDRIKMANTKYIY